MAPVLRHVVLPCAGMLCACLLLLAAATHYPFWTSCGFGLCLAVALFHDWNRRKRDFQRRWRVGHEGRDQMFYDELRNRTWCRIVIDGEMLVGKAHHIIYFGSLNLPEWAQKRRAEIVARIKSEFCAPGYEYEGG